MVPTHCAGITMIFSADPIPNYLQVEQLADGRRNTVIVPTLNRIEVSTMRFFFAFVLQQTVSHNCNGFSSTYSATTTSSSHHSVDGRISNPSPSSLFVATDGNHQQEEYVNKVAVSIATTTAATTLTLGLWAMNASPSLAEPLTNPTVISSSSSSFVVAGYSESDFTDFSLPSYKDVSAAEINTNLKGGKLLFGEEASSSSTR